MLNKIESILDTEIRPLLASHGGDIQVVQITADNYAKIKLLGTCASCQAQQQTVENLIESVLQEKIPALQGALIVQQISDDLLAEALQIIRGNKKP